MWVETHISMYISSQNTVKMWADEISLSTVHAYDVWLPMPQMMNCATEVSSQAGRWEGRRKRKPSSLTPQETGTSPSHGQLPQVLSTRGWRQVLPRNSLITMSSRCFAMFPAVFAARGISVALKGSVTARQPDQLMLGMSCLCHCIWWHHHMAKCPSLSLRPKVKQSAHQGLKILNSSSTGAEEGTS